MANKIQQITVINQAPDPDEMGVVVRPIGGAAGSGDGAVLDGANSAIRATVFDLLNSNPQAVVLVDANGDILAGSAVSIADGADVVEGSLADAAVTGDTAGTVNAKLRGLSSLIQAGGSPSLNALTVQGFSGGGKFLVITDTSQPGGTASHADALAILAALTTSGVVGPTLNTSHNFTFNNETFDVDVSQFGSLAIYQATLVGGFDGTLQMEGSPDGTTFSTVFAIRNDDGQRISAISAAITNGIVRVNVSGLKTFRLRNTGFTVGSSNFLISGAAHDYDDAGKSLYDGTTGVPWKIDNFNSGRVRIFNSGGTDVAVDGGVGLSGSDPGFLALGDDGANARHLRVDTNGNPLGALKSPTSVTGSITPGSTLAIPTSNQAAVVITVTATVAPGGTISFEATNNNGANWFNIPAKNLIGTTFDVGGMIQSFDAGSVFPGFSVFVVPCGGFQQIRLNGAGFFAGSITFVMTATPDNSLHDSGIFIAGNTSSNPVHVDIARNGIIATVKNSNEAALPTDGALVVALSPNSPLPTGSVATVEADVETTTNTDLLSNAINQKATLTKDARLRTEQNNDALIGAIEMLTAEINELKLVMQFAHGINLS